MYEEENSFSKLLIKGILQIWPGDLDLWPRSRCSRTDRQI